MEESKFNIDEIVQKIEELSTAYKAKELREYCEKFHPADIAEAINEIESNKNRIIILRLLQNNIASDTFTYIHKDIQEEIIKDMSNHDVKILFDELFTDDIVEIIEELPSNMVRRILKVSTKEDREKINQILQYENESAGSIMSVDFIKLKETAKCTDALEKIKKFKDTTDSLDGFYVVDEFNNIKGYVELKDIIFAKKDEFVKDVMTEKITTARTNTDQEEIALIMNKYDFKSMPIVNNLNKLVGVVTIDDILDVLKEEATEDIHKLAGIAPVEEQYFKTSVWKMVKSRSVWLLFLMVSATLSQIVITAFMGLYDIQGNDGGEPIWNDKTYVVTMLLTPLLTVIAGTSGNAGSQSSTMVIRALSLREVSTKDYGKVLWKEFRVASITGLILISVNFVRMIIIYAIQYKGDINHLELWYSIATVSVAMYLTLIFAKLVGGTLPILAKKIKLDPAVMAAPLLTTLVDTLSTAIFFGTGLLFFSYLM